VSLGSISGFSQWITASFSIGAGTQTITWAYEKDTSVASGLDTGWVDNVQFTPGTTTPSVPPTLPPAGTSSLVNGGFESTGGWTFSPASVIVARPTGLPALTAGGNSLAAFCGTNNCSQRMSQTIAVPSNASAVIVDFWNFIGTAETGPTAGDTLTVELISVTNPTSRTVVATLSNVNAASTWQRVTREISGFAGQTVELRFTAVTDFSQATNFYVDNVQAIFRTIAGAATLPESGWYWNAAESGRGWAIERQGDRLFTAGFMYETNGVPVWYVSTLSVQSDGTYLGNLDRYVGGQSLLGPWRAPTASTIARLRARFPDPRNAVLTTTAITAGGAAGAVIETANLTRFPISTPTAFLPPSSMGTSGWWWNEAEGGRGYFIEVQGQDAFVAQFGYTTQGAPNWYVSRMRVSGSAFDTMASARMDEYANGQALGGTYRTPIVTGSPGQWSIRFLSASTGVLTLPDGRMLTIRRYAF
jgi:hypothetical protein